MYLTEISHHLSPFKKPPSASSAKSLANLFQTFEETLALRLKSLLPPAATFSYLSLAANVAASTHTDARALISDPSLSGSDSKALSSYLDSSIKLLDVCNAISADIERLQRGRLLIHFATHLLLSSSDKVKKAKDSIFEWKELAAKKGGGGGLSGDLIRGLSRRDLPPKGKMSAIWRVVYAVEAVSYLVSGIIVACLGGEWVPAAGAKVPVDFAWAAAYNQLVEETCRRQVEEMEAVVSRVEKLTEALDGAERVRSTAEEMVGPTKTLTEGLDRLGNAVSGLFRSAMGTRNAALNNFRMGPQKCK